MLWNNEFSQKGKCKKMLLFESKYIVWEHQKNMIFKLYKSITITIPCLVKGGLIYQHELSLVNVISYDQYKILLFHGSMK